MTDIADEVAPEEILRATPPPDDAGAQTADRYEWQAMMATADVLALYFQSLDDAGNLSLSDEATVVCEHHEDWSIVHNGSTELVSGKHREASIAPITSFRQVLNEAGVLHLFRRWMALERTPRCRVVTTGGLAGDGRKIARGCDQLREDPASNAAELLALIDHFKAALVGQLPPDVAEPDTDGIRSFLAGLRFQDAQPRRDQLPDLAAERYGRPVAERLGRPSGGAAAWQAAFALVRPRMRNAGPSVGGGLPVVLGVEHDDSLAPRTLSVRDVDIAVRFALNNLAGYAPLPRIIKANRMAVKMSQGGCSDNAVERADELRLQYRRYWRARLSHPNTGDHRSRLDNILRRAVDEATDVVRTETHPWGAQLWRHLSEGLQDLEGQTDAHGLSADLLLGGVSELANTCRVWYTDRFDAQEMLRQLVAGEAAS
ncbi:hypothetical protein [Ornithinimicrobium murale]|uniref:hypothetical protein n=1 Tax=Ornithinimicrobium murale TaxID=1050153 RepID=UPI000E0CD7A0|nr:hypothetical protein [Ornithinimicrobium murale]